MEKIIHPCELCRTDFLGHPNSRFCPKCSSERRKQKIREWQRSNREKMKGYQKRYYENNFNMEFSKEEREKIMETISETALMSKYCKSYDDTNLDCIKCYENQIAPYKACHRK